MAGVSEPATLPQSRPRFQIRLRTLFWATALAASLAGLAAAALQRQEVVFVRSIDFSPDGKLLLAVFSSGDVLLIDVSGDEPRQRASKLRVPRDELGMEQYGVRFCGPRTVAMADYEHDLLRVWDLDLDREARQIKVGRFELLAISAERSWAFVAASDPRSIDIIDTRSGGLVRSIRTETFSPQLANFSIDPTATVVTTDSDWQTLDWFSTDTGVKIRTSTFEVPRMVYLPQGGEVIFCTDWNRYNDGDKLATFYDHSGKPIRSIQPGIDGLLQAEFSADGSRFLLWSSEGTAAEVWPLDGKRPLCHLYLGEPASPDGAAQYFATLVRLSRDGRRVASAGVNRPLRVFDVASGQEKWTLWQPPSQAPRWWSIIITTLGAAASAIALVVSLPRRH